MRKPACPTDQQSLTLCTRNPRGQPYMRDGHDRYNVPETPDNKREDLSFTSDITIRDQKQPLYTYTQMGCPSFGKQFDVLISSTMSMD
jgi:hypothetical protein